jgi:hypothetical protein
MPLPTDTLIQIAITAIATLLIVPCRVHAWLIQMIASIISYLQGYLTHMQKHQ